MRIHTHETILNIYDETKTLISTKTAKTFVIYPSEGKALRNILTGLVTYDYVGVGREELIKNYEEIDKE